jgi:hypothetical protein
MQAEARRQEAHAYIIRAERSLQLLIKSSVPRSLPLVFSGFGQETVYFQETVPLVVLQNQAGASKGRPRCITSTKVEQSGFLRPPIKPVLRTPPLAGEHYVITNSVYGPKSNNVTDSYETEPT